VCDEGRVDRAGSYNESWGESCRGVLSGRSPREVPMAGTSDKERSQGGVSLWDETPGWRCCFSTGHRVSRQAGPRFTPHEDFLFGHPKD
jgi:hypothetical protein